MRQISTGFVSAVLTVALMCSWVSGDAAHAADAPLTIAAASDLNFAFKEIIALYERQSGEHVALTLGSSGNFYAQIGNGAPFDLYFSADIGYPKRLEEAGLTVPGSLYRYAVGRIVLWTSKQAPWDVSMGLDVLRDPRIKKIAIANPKHAPYGRAAVAAMETAGVAETVREKLVLGENISQAAQFVESGAADIGIIALSLAPAMQAQGTSWTIPAELHAPLEQGAAIVAQSKKQDAAKKFLMFLQSAAGQEVMARYGFTQPR
ncbi:MAG: molybdate ABC transporter substrate-binding protein [Nitrospiraceae bacterium]